MAGTQDRHAERRALAFWFVLGRFSQQTRKELHAVIGRGINTWPDAPRWIVLVYDRISKELTNGNV